MEYLTIQEVSEILRVKHRTVQSYIRKGLIPAIKLSNKTVLIPKDRLAQRLKELTQG